MSFDHAFSHTAPEIVAEGPTPLVGTIPHSKPYPVDALGPFKEAVESVRAITQAPVAIPAQSALATASLAIQGFANVDTLGGFRPPSLYLMTIAQSGERKSSCDAPLMSALREYEREQSKMLSEDVSSWQNTHAIWKVERDQILADAKKAKGKKRVESQADLEALGKEPTAPPSNDRTVTEPTFEGLTRKYVEGQPSLGIFSDEGGQFLGGHAMNSDNRQKTLAALNDLWQGNPIQRTRAGEGSISLYGRRLAMHLMVQPSVARAFIADAQTTETGFLPRFLICEPPSTIGTRLHEQVRRNEMAIDDFSGRLAEILITPLPIDRETRELSPRELKLSDDARALLINYSNYVELEQVIDGRFSHVIGTASKSAEQAARIAAVMTLWDDINASEVSKSTMADAISVADYYLEEAARLADAAVQSNELAKVEKLRNWLLEKWQYSELMPSDIVQNAPARDMRNLTFARKAISILVGSGHLIKLDEGTVVRGAIRKEAYVIEGHPNGL